MPVAGSYTGVAVVPTLGPGSEQPIAAEAQGAPIARCQVILPVLASMP